LEAGNYHNEIAMRNNFTTTENKLAVIDALNFVSSRQLKNNIVNA
jgi:hypothetical protein